MEFHVLWKKFRIMNILKLSKSTEMRKKTIRETGKNFRENVMSQ